MENCNELIKGKRSITIESAIKLSSILKTSPELWLNLQMIYDLDKYSEKRLRA